MNFENKYIDELIDDRRIAREEKNWELSDQIRDYLDSNHIFVFDNPEGQEVYHRNTGTREDIFKEIQNEIRINNVFGAWLFSTLSSMGRKDDEIKEVIKQLDW